MYEKCLIIALLSYQISLSYENERDIRIKSYDNVRSYPMKVAYFNAPKIRQQQQPQYGKVMRLKSVSDQKNQKFKREYLDNVRGESKLIPQSRQDILNIKQLSYHGRDRPTAEPLIAPQNNSTTNIVKKFTSTTDIPKVNQRNDFYSAPKSSSKPQKIHKKEYNTKPNNKVENIHHYIPDDSPFYPLMKPSPINVMPTKPPSFDTVRNYVQYLKMRQQKYFSDFNDDDQPVSDEKSSKQIKQGPFEGEIDYFKEREVELAREEHQRNNQFSPANFKTSIHDVDDVEQPYKDDDESEIITKNNSEEKAEISRAADDNEHENEDDATGYSNYADDETIDNDNGEEESKKKENFVPFRLYAQVRHVEADHHEKPTRSNIKEKVSLAKKNIYYKEEGYEDQNYDHGAEKINYDLKHKKNSNKKRRSKRSTNGDIDVSQLPVALAYIKKSEIPQLTGEKLFKHLDELIRNSSVYLPDDDDDDDSRPIRFTPIRPSSKYPYYNSPNKALSQLSAHRYSENLRNFPKAKESLYDYKNAKPCEEIQEDIDPVPKDIEEEDKSTEYNKKPKRLNNLGDKIKCFREKYFGKDPFDNPLFKEDEYVEATIPIPVNQNISRQANPLITVYDDVINNIRSGILSEFKRKRAAEDVLKQASEQIAIKSKQVVIPNYSSVVGVSQLPMFDINTFLPKFRGSISKFSDEEDDSSNETVDNTVTESPKAKKKRNNLSLENHQLDPPSVQLKSSKATENSKVKPNKYNKKKKIVKLNQVPETPPPIPVLLKNSQPTKNAKTSSNNQKFRRYVAPNTFVYPTKHITSYTQSLPPPNSNGKTTYRFKLL